MDQRLDNQNLIPSIVADTLVFDLDGTLVDSIPGIGSSLAAAFLLAGREMPTADLRCAIGPPISIIARNLEPSLTDDEVAQIERYYRAEYDTDGWRKTILFHGVAETLHSLHQRGYRLFIVTNKPLIPTEKILHRLGLQGLFEEVLTRDSRNPTYGSKAEMLCDLLNRRTLLADKTVMIGDTSEDGEAAAANRLRFAYVTYGYGTVPSASTSIDNFSDLQQLLVVNQPPQKNKKASA